MMLIPSAQDSERLPVISASVTPIKVRPADPGGMKIPFQDIIIMNPTLSASADKPHRLQTPPEAPLPLPEKYQHNGPS